MTRLTEAQRRALEDLALGRPLHAGHGRRSLLALWLRGYVDCVRVGDMRPLYSLNAAGRALLSETEHDD